ncbi:MAG TPA: PilZ domain-containing protein [Polyangiaceae bacterium]|jgi:hypothetical protein
MISRWKAQIPVTILEKSRTTALLTDSVDQHGVFVRTDAPLAPMTLVRMKFVLPPNDEELVTHGMVTEVVKQDSLGAPGVRIRFFAAAGEELASWHQFIQYLRQRHPAAVARSVVIADAEEENDAAIYVDGLERSDFSAGSFFLKCHTPLSVGTHVRVSIFAGEGGAQLGLHCVVRRQVSGREGGIGLECRDMTPPALRQLDTFLRATSTSLRAELRVMRVPAGPASMQTVPGPFGSSTSLALDEPWSIPPTAEWAGS